ncbi:hypothetical protein B566_EDAN001351 [Ephemera danica]|nr:hypothetical protein B566_EDAN001351 [Ephemera danica]
MWSQVLFTTVVGLCCLQLGSCNNDATKTFDMEEGSIVDRNRFLSWLMNRGTDNEINVDGNKIDRNRFISWFMNLGSETDDKGISHKDLIERMKSYSPQFQLFFDRLNELLDIFEAL